MNVQARLPVVVGGVAPRAAADATTPDDVQMDGTGNNGTGTGGTDIDAGGPQGGTTGGADVNTDDTAAGGSADDPGDTDVRMGDATAMAAPAARPTGGRGRGGRGRGGRGRGRGRSLPPSRGPEPPSPAAPSQSAWAASDCRKVQTFLRERGKLTVNPRRPEEKVRLSTEQATELAIMLGGSFVVHEDEPDPEEDRRRFARLDAIISEVRVSAARNP